MPTYTYLGPYDELRPEGPDGPVYKRGDKVKLTKEQKEAFGRRVRWSDTELEDATPTLVDLSDMPVPPETHEDAQKK